MIPKKNSTASADTESAVSGALKSPRLQVISETGENLGVLPREEAMSRAASLGLDVVLVSETGALQVPIVRIMNLKKKLYEDKKRLTQAKKKQHEAQIKEIRLSVRIGEHDLETKMRQGSQFLIDGDRLKICLMLRGREKALKDTFGVELFNKVTAHEKDLETPVAWSRVYYLKKQ